MSRGDRRAGRPDRTSGRAVWGLWLWAATVSACGTRVVELSLPPDLTPAVSDAGGVPATCKVSVTGDTRCLLCGPSANGATETICLKCDALVTSSAAVQCRLCTWTDDFNHACLQCFGADKLVTQDTCDALRPEQLIYPSSGTTDAGSKS